MKIKKITSQNSLVTKNTQPARRRLLKTIAGGGAIATAAAVVPTTWIKPVIKTVTLPAHAQTSVGVPPGGPTTYALIVLSGPAIRSAGSTPPDLECRNGPELDPITIGLVPADGSKDGQTINMTRTWTNFPANVLGKNVSSEAVVISGNQAVFQPQGGIPGIDACNDAFNDTGTSITLDFTIDDASATPTSSGPFTAENLL